ncbi:Bacteriocin-protection, YdeI or OmpD-Associated [Daejeonella rubra]|uniref:Bacteriocin-protection, YdeI or OmpD-Associated n=1 Tax=Daejeonella rubra TaxID=990371 RepID=A0A1G9PC69_9SPHI|nr:YdeI/OmpD-associated family protein [Daejeonella rubra]SDL96143.1 Bacteriocin-protection, YdeI or OmpD-Associated [Daejeonella rubra]
MAGSKVLSFNVHLEPVEGPMVHHVIIVPDEFSKQFITGKGSACILCSIGQQPEFPCALIPRHERFVIIASKKLIKEHNLQLEIPFRISIRIDPGNGLELPEEFSEVLAQDEFAFQAYEALNDGGKRGYIYYIRQGKSIDTRIKRSMEIAEKLKQRHGSKQ